MTITLEDYFGRFGNSSLAVTDLSDTMRANAERTVERANQLLILFGEDRAVNSGWRPTWYNRTIPNAAPNSKHMTCEAIDLADPEGDLDDYCYRHPHILADLGLWMEHPAATKGWCHVQIVPPRSGNRIFYP